MHDQASRLREMMTAVYGVQTEVPRRIIAMIGGKNRVGNSTACVAIARTMANAGRNVLLVDADLERGDLGALCSLQDQEYSIQDVLDQRASLTSALQPGPSGCLVLPTRQVALDTTEYNSDTLRAFFTRLGPLAGSDKNENAEETGKQQRPGRSHELDGFADVVILDCGNQTSGVLAAAGELADELVVTTTTETNSVLHAYSVMKALVGWKAKARIHVLVNGASSDLQATEVADRIADGCRLCLGRTINRLGWIPHEPALIDLPSESIASQSLEMIATSLIDQAGRQVVNSQRGAMPYNEENTSGTGMRQTLRTRVMTKRKARLNEDY